MLCIVVTRQVQSAARGGNLNDGRINRLSAAGSRSAAASVTWCIAPSVRTPARLTAAPSHNRAETEISTQTEFRDFQRLLAGVAHEVPVCIVEGAHRLCARVVVLLFSIAVALCVVERSFVRAESGDEGIKLDGLVAPNRVSSARSLESYHALVGPDRYSRRSGGANRKPLRQLQLLIARTLQLPIVNWMYNCNSCSL